MSFRILCTGDIHIGRRSSKTTDTYRCADTWLAIVDHAIAETVDLVAISGDVIDKESKSYEAIGPLMTGLERLATAGIETVAVSGNHDHDILFRVAETAGSARLRLLGRHGRWEHCDYAGADGSSIRVHGWSFSRERVPTSPLLDFPSMTVHEGPSIALVHGDVGVPQSHYAPLSLADLWSRPIDFWLLGHIHAPNQFTGPTRATALYPGSPLAMDPGEGGAHGVWIADIRPHEPVALTHRVISPVHYARTDIDVSFAADESEFQNALTISLREVGKQLNAEHEPGTLREAICRVRLIGENRFHRQIAGWAARAQSDLGALPVSATATVRVDRIESLVRPPINLEEFARSNDLAGETARLILALDSDAQTTAQAHLVNEIGAAATRIRQHSGYGSLVIDDAETDESPATEDALNDIIREQAWQLLSQLVTQKEPA